MIAKCNDEMVLGKWVSGVAGSGIAVGLSRFEYSMVSELFYGLITANHALQKVWKGKIS